MKSTVVLVSQYSFPEGDAGAVRVYNIAIAIKKLGYNVIVIALGEYNKDLVLQEYNGISYYSIRSKYGITTFLFFSINLYHILRIIQKKYNVSNIILGTSLLDTLIFLKYYCRFKKINIIKDVVEWYSVDQFKLGRLSIWYVLKNIENKYFLGKSVKIISISKYLNSYFLNKGNKSVRIPIFFETSNYKIIKKQFSTGLNIIYAGSPGKKDYLGLICNAISLLNKEELDNLSFSIIGVNEAQLLNLIDPIIYEKIKNNLNIYGRRSRHFVLTKLKEVDFSVLIRDSESRYSKAGFPSKVIESMLYETPMICNYSSDLSEFLIDDFNALIVNDMSPESFLYSLRKALNMSSEEKRIIGYNARKTCEEKFDTNNYLELLKKILT